MYYVEVDSPRYRFTTSYFDYNTATQWGKPILASGEWHLHANDEGKTFVETEYNSEADVNLGRIRSIFTRDMAAEGTPCFDLYTKDADLDEGNWVNTGVSFMTYKDANATIKGPLANSYNDMMIVENPNASVLNRTLIEHKVDQSVKELPF